MKIIAKKIQNFFFQLLNELGDIIPLFSPTWWIIWFWDMSAHLASLILIFNASIRIVYDINFEDLIGDTSLNILIIFLWIDILFKFNTILYVKGVEVTDR